MIAAGHSRLPAFQADEIVPRRQVGFKQDISAPTVHYVVTQETKGERR
jgi:hypothetical protein